MSDYLVMTSTGDGPEIWKANLSYEEAQQEKARAEWEFGGTFWIERQKGNPLNHIPDCTPR